MQYCGSSRRRTPIIIIMLPLFLLLISFCRIIMVSFQLPLLVLFIIIIYVWVGILYNKREHHHTVDMIMHLHNTCVLYNYFFLLKFNEE